jgi:hypothetical protein
MSFLGVYKAQGHLSTVKASYLCNEFALGVFEMATREEISTKPVRRRRVFYIPGYDPIHPRRYRELYRKEGEVQAKISGYEIEIEGKRSDGPYGWRVKAKIDGQVTESTVEVLVWSDVVRASMANDIPHTYYQMVKTAWIYLSTGALFRLMRLRKGPILAALYPVLMLLFQLFLAVFIGWQTAQIGTWFFADADLFSGMWFWIAMLIVPIFILRWFKAKDNKFFAYYLMHDFAFSAKDRGADAPELQGQMEKFRSIIAEALSEDLDEVLIVGHSSGAHLGISILADLIREEDHSADSPNLSFLSLGHVVPMVSFLPKANKLRGDLHFLSARPEVTWIDVTAPGDGCAFALCDPVGVSGVAPDNKLWPLVFSAAFTQSLSAERWKELRWRFFRLHFQYLCAFDRPKDYDYFQITGGPLSLAERYAARTQSKSRITHAVSGYRAMK